MSRGSGASTPRELVEAYACAVDHRDAEALGALFDPDAVLTTPSGELRGRTAIAGVPARHIQRYRVTHHLLGGQILGPGTCDTEATGTVECTAHHVYELNGIERVYVMHIRYHDRYRRDGDGWVFTDRRLELLWDEDHPRRS